MSLNFTAKRKVIAQLTDPSNWENRFDPSFFDDQRRRWRSESYNGITVSYDNSDPNVREVLITHNASQAELLIQQQDIGFLVTDERGITLSSNTPYSERQLINADEPSISAANDTQEDLCPPIGIPHLNAYVQFSSNGRKRVTFEESDSFIELEAAENPTLKPLRNGRFVHANTVGMDFLNALAKFKTDPLTFVTIVAAKDLGLEPSLKSFNGLSHAGTASILQEALKLTEADEWNRLKKQLSNALKRSGGIAMLEKPWRDSAEFDGYKAALPRNFSIAKTEDGFDIHTCSSGKERILARGLLFSAAANGLPSLHTLPDSGMKAVLKLLADAKTINDRGNNQWHVIAIDHKENFEGMTQLSDYAVERYHLTVDDFAVINISRTKAVIAIREKALDNALSSPEPMPIQTEKKPEAPNVVRPEFGLQ